MIRFLNALKKRNPALYWFGWYNLFIALLCMVVIYFDRTQVLGINRWIKPVKFYLSVGTMAWSMGWMLYYLSAKRSVTICTWLIIVTMTFENAIILFQAFRKQPSHFNVSTPMDGFLFSMMGMMIFLFTLTVIYAMFLFFREKDLQISRSYHWGIRMGLLLFILFSLEGGIMVGLLSHSIAGKDGGAGLPLMNWSTRHGDLRIAHFMGIHALQIIPLAGYYLFKTRKQVLFFSLTYFLAVMSMLLLALLGIPLISIR